jgi:hypothetical protein
MNSALEWKGKERLVRVAAGPVTLEGPVGLCCSLTAAGAVGTAPAIDSDYLIFFGSNDKLEWRAGFVRPPRSAC